MYHNYYLLLMTYLLYLVNKFDKKRKVNFQYMATEDSLNIYLYDDLMYEVEIPKIQCHKILLEVHRLHSTDGLKISIIFKQIINKIKP
jgi:hypothetical protein